MPSPQSLSDRLRRFLPERWRKARPRVAVLRLQDGVVAEARLGLGGVAATPILATEAAAALVGRVPDAAAIAAAAGLAAECFTPTQDITASPEYRRDLVRAVTRRALHRALA